MLLLPVNPTLSLWMHMCFAERPLLSASSSSLPSQCCFSCCVAEANTRHLKGKKEGRWGFEDGDGGRERGAECALLKYTKAALMCQQRVAAATTMGDGGGGWVELFCTVCALTTSAL
jgi:hypothetical protein